MKNRRMMATSYSSTVQSGWCRAALTSFLVTVVLSGCSLTKPHRAPVEERSSAPVEAPAASGAGVVETKTPLAEPLRTGTYTVRSGDTLIRIALDHGLGWRDLARWNGLDNPNLIEVGQVLRVVPPSAGDAASSRAVAAARIESKALEAKGTEPTKPGVTPATAPTGAVPSSAPSGAPESDLVWGWPANGPFLSGFDGQRGANGLAIGGKAGDPVFAAADGRVMYAGSGLRGYGNMVIIKHNDTYLSAYAHNQSLVVKEDQVVKKGQLIAEMGNSDADQVKLHFEIRRKGKPIDPARLLPSR